MHRLICATFQLLLCGDFRNVSATVRPDFTGNDYSIYTFQFDLLRIPNTHLHYPRKTISLILSRLVDRAWQAGFRNLPSIENFLRVRCHCELAQIRLSLHLFKRNSGYNNRYTFLSVKSVPEAFKMRPASQVFYLAVFALLGPAHGSHGTASSSSLYTPDSCAVGRLLLLARSL